ncbi:MATE family efflux transporter [Pseudoalteromonas piscicida]|uniref:MATE family efflux transporter n=1 Tax=Pseudoalteromonas piscicida TaxID=43662 RepID=UPI001CB7D521
MGSVSTAILISNNILVSINYIFIMPLVALGITVNSLIANEIGKDRNPSILLNASLLVGTLYLSLVFLIINTFDSFLFELFTPDSVDESLANEFGSSLLPMFSYVVVFCYSSIFSKYLESYKKNKLVFNVRFYISTVINVSTLYFFINIFGGREGVLSLAWYLGAVFEFFAAVVLYFYTLKIKRGSYE